MGIFEKAKWIWLVGGSSPDSYAEFYDSFIWTGAMTSLSLSCDSDYTLWINEKYVASNQYGDFEHYKIYDTLDITPFLLNGKNEIKILVHYFGEDSQRYRTAPAGLIYEVSSEGEMLAASSERTLSRLSPTYESGRRVKVSGQLGFTFFYDATKDTEGGLTPSAVIEKSCSFFPRPIKKAAVLDRREPKSVTKIDDRHYLIDLGGEVVGLPSLEFTTHEEQTLTVAWGEHIADGCVRREIGNRHFYYGYTAAAGHNIFNSYMLRLGCRYIEVFAEKPIELIYAGVLPQVYEVVERPVFIRNELDRKIYDICVNTLRLSMMEHYVDCPWREQALYAFDSRNQMLCGYYAFESGNAEYARANLKLIGQDTRPDRLLSICYPCGSSLAIPSFSLYYIVEMEEYLRHTGDTSLAGVLLPKLEGILNEFLGNAKDGLVCKLEGDKMWNFYDWSDYSAGTLGRAEAAVPDLALNCLFIIALDRLERICASLGKKFAFAGLAESMRPLVLKHFFTEKEMFTMHEGDEQYNALGNSLAILAKVATGSDAEALCEKMLGGAMSDCSLSMKILEYQALLDTNEEKYKDTVLAEIRRNYKVMLDYGSDTVWETMDGESAFRNAGSLCHGWSAVPVYIFHRLGIAKN